MESSVYRKALVAQTDIQAALDELHAQTGDLAHVLKQLEEWSVQAGYFDHLTDENEYLSFEGFEGRPALRLQINYSRLSYKGASGERRPVCPLCIENIGSPGKELLRVFEVELAGADYFVHLTPFPLHPGHFVANSRRHKPMRVGRAALGEAMDFVKRCRGWLAASNSDIAWAGASVLEHHHFQVLRATMLPIEMSSPEMVRDANGVRVSLLNWACPSVRLEGDGADVLERADELIGSWKKADPGKTTCNYLVRSSDGTHAVVHLLFRHSDFRTPGDLRAIKKEGVGIIEMSGEIIIPPLEGMSREENVLFLRREGARICQGILEGNSPSSDRYSRRFFAELAGFEKP